MTVLVLFVGVFVVDVAVAQQRTGSRKAAVKQTVPPNIYDSSVRCLQALQEGKGFYEPTFFGDAKKAPSRPVKFTRGLEANACVRLKIVGGKRRWVPQKAGTQYNFDADGKVIRRADCGNEADEVHYLLERSSVSVVPVQPVPEGVAPSTEPSPVKEAEPKKEVEVVNLRKEIERVAKEQVLEDALLSARVERDHLEEKSWWDRHWKWFVPVVVAAAGAGVWMATRGGKEEPYKKPGDFVPVRR